MADRPRKTFSIEGARIILPNFSGREGRYNREGDRQFLVEIPEGLVETLLEEGWNVRDLKPRDEDSEPTPTVQVSVDFDRTPPRVVMMSNSAKLVLNEDTISMLDWADIENIDLTVRGSMWERDGRSGVKAYLQSLYVKIVDDPIRRKYEDA